MVKQRMASADVAAEVACLRQNIIGLRLANMYDLNPKTYVLKLAKSGADGDKVFLLLESGTRLHTVQVIRDKPNAPSNFTLKLRKHLRTRRVEEVRQLGVDRVVDLVFGVGDNAHHLILEMYAQGNLILTDSKYEVLTLLRSHRDDNKNLAIMARHPYPMTAVRLRAAVSREDVAAALAAAAGGGSEPAVGGAGVEGAAGEDEGDQRQPEADPEQTGGNGAAGKGGKTAKKGKKESAVNSPSSLRNALLPLLPYGPSIADHVALSAGLEPGRCVAAQPLSEGEVGALMKALGALEAWFAGLEAAAPGGYVTANPVKSYQRQQKAPAPEGDGATAAAGDGQVWVYQDFNPLRLAQTAALPSREAPQGSAPAAAAPASGSAAGEQEEAAAAAAAGGVSSAAPEAVGPTVLTFPTFDAALDEFYSKVVEQRLDVAKVEAEKAAMSRLDKIRSDQTQRAAALEAEAAAAELRASLIEYNLEAVDAALAAVNAVVASGMSWGEIEALIKEERRSGNPVAGLIHTLQLDQNRVTLLLSNNLDEEDEEALTRPATLVPVDLALSAYANAAHHHGARKRQTAKQVKTLAANEAALVAAEKKAAAQLAHLRNNATVAQVVRKPAWYERFHWFISSENYLVISGRDAQQNELIVKRYFRRGDAYVHADLHGASSTIVRNHTPDKPLPPLTLQQAGCACVCRSRAWDQKVVTSAWWVHHEQVSKAAPSGEYLPTGSFMIRGKKNYLPPEQLLFGFAIMFKLEDSCIGRHAGERAVRGGLLEEEGEEEGGDGGREESRLEQQESADTSIDGTEASISSSSRQLSTTTSLDAFMEGGYEVLAAAASSSRGAANNAAGGGAPRGGRGAEQLYSRYGISAAAAAAASSAAGMREEEEEEGPSSSGQGGSHRHVSAAARAAAKKGNPAQQNGAASSKAAGGGRPPPGPSAGGGGGMGAAQQQQQQQQAAAAGGGGGGARGKKAKAVKAKAKSKYQDQDEEDRQLALAVLGSAGNKKSRTERRAERKAKKEGKRRSTAAPVGPGQQEMDAAIAAATGKQFEDVGGSGSSSGSDSGSDDEQQQKQQQGLSGKEASGGPAPASASAAAEAADGEEDPAGSSSGDEDADAEAAAAAAGDEAEAAEIRALLEEENVTALPYGEGDSNAAALQELDALTGLPRADDVLMYAVPVCGPYAALVSYKYKVKLTPGTLKKGKAARQVLELMLRGGAAGGGGGGGAGEVLPRERELMRSIPEGDSIAAMVGSVKISMPGLQQLKARDKKAKKAAAQARAGAQGGR